MVVRSHAQDMAPCAVIQLSDGAGTAARYRRAARHSDARRTCKWLVRSAIVGSAAALCMALGLVPARLAGKELPESRWAGAFVDVDAVGNDVPVLRQPPAELFQDGGSMPERLTGLFPRMERHFCALEGHLCRCIGTVALHSWTGNWAMIRRVNHSMRCTTDAFGDDPRPHFAKFCSCWPGLPWPPEVIDGLNATLGRNLIPRIEIGAPNAGCSPEDDGAWTSCAVMNERVDASLLPDRLVPRLEAQEQEDVTLRKLDVCHRIAGADQALRVLGVWPTAAALMPAPVKATSAPICAVVYAPGRGPVWDSRAAIFCPTDPPNCLEEACECADEAHSQIDVNADQNTTACWACAPPQQQQQRTPEPVNRRTQPPAPAARASGQEAAPAARQPSPKASPPVSAAVAIGEFR